MSKEKVNTIIMSL